jgi:thiol-disulfide isomerase/thioredoxin
MLYFNRFLNAAVVLLLLFAVGGYVASLWQPSSHDAKAEVSPLPSAISSILTPLDKDAFDAILASSDKTPVFLMIYASWCPHCKRMFGELNALQAEYKGKIRIVTLSIDKKPADAEAYVRGVTPLHVETYIIHDADSYRAIGDALRSFGLQFQGGLSNNVSVPYNTVFYQGQPVAEIGGAISSESLNAVVSDIVKNAK